MPKNHCFFLYFGWNCNRKIWIFDFCLDFVLEIFSLAALLLLDADNWNYLILLDFWTFLPGFLICSLQIPKYLDLNFLLERMISGSNCEKNILEVAKEKMKFYQAFVEVVQEDVRASRKDFRLSRMKYLDPQRTEPKILLRKQIRRNASLYNLFREELKEAKKELRFYVKRVERLNVSFFVLLNYLCFCENNFWIFFFLFLETWEDQAKTFILKPSVLHHETQKKWIGIFIFYWKFVAFCSHVFVFWNCIKFLMEGDFHQLFIAV